MQLFFQYLPYFLLVFCRITSFFVVAPIYSSRGVPIQFKIGFSIFVALFTFFTLSIETSVSWDLLIIPLILKEVLIGLLLGFVAYLFFMVVQISGSFVDMQMGFGIANVIDPMTGTQSPVLGNFKFFIMTLIFLAMNGHHLLLRGIMQSYEWVPIDHKIFQSIEDGTISAFLVESFTLVFASAFQMTAPLIAALFLTDVALGILAKTAPQFNIFVVGIPLKIIVGYVMLLLLVPGFLYLFTQLFETMFNEMSRLLDLIGST
ncbi:flagellar biosynthetic protein FliR [Marinicrinis sediminis]|uniref:Flagellar biosynthetic protein FliR n=1 Tax=Marinicrinis sediminis TaxID=1652465 RepID=A0ABW5R524_9BACL